MGDASSRTRDLLALGVIALVTAAAAVVGGFGTREAIDSWYREAPKPAWTPPDWVFAPVWTVLYAAMAVAAWWVWRAPPSKPRSMGLVLYGVQLALNALWSVLFFARRAIALALVDIVFLLAAIIMVLALFWRVDRRAGLLFAPYVAWVAYATSLNVGFWWLAR